MVGCPQKNTIRQEVEGAVQFLGHFSQPAGYCSSQSADKWLSLLIRITRAAAWRKRATRFFGENTIRPTQSRWKSNVLFELIPLETCRASPYHHKRDDGWWFRPSFNWILQTQFIVSGFPANRILLFVKNPLQVRWQHPIRWLPLDGFAPFGHMTSSRRDVISCDRICLLRCRDCWCQGSVITEREIRD